VNSNLLAGSVFILEILMRLSNLKITPKLGILVGMTLVGLCATGILANYLMRHAMVNARLEQCKAIAQMARNMAIGLQKQVNAGQMTKDAAIAEFSRRGNTLSYDNGVGYLFAYTMEGVTVLSPDPKYIGQNRLDVVTNGRSLVREQRDGVLARGEYTQHYEFAKPGQEEPIRKISTPLQSPNGICSLAPASILTILIRSCDR
jgi:methyl-accepting chemotaxis protein